MRTTIEPWEFERLSAVCKARSEMLMLTLLVQESSLTLKAELNEVIRMAGAIGYGPDARAIINEVLVAFEENRPTRPGTRNLDQPLQVPVLEAAMRLMTSGSSIPGTASSATGSSETENSTPSEG